MIEVVRQRRVDLPTNPISERQVGTQSPLILNEGVILPGACINEAAARLTIGVWNAKQEVRAWIASGEWAAPRKPKRTVVFEAEGIRNVAPANVHAPFVSVLARGVGNIVEKLACIINPGLRTVVGKAQRKESRNVDSRCTLRLGDLRDDPCKSDRKSTRLNSSHQSTSRMPS